MLFGFFADNNDLCSLIYDQGCKSWEKIHPPHFQPPKRILLCFAFHYLRPIRQNSKDSSNCGQLCFLLFKSNQDWLVYLEADLLPLIEGQVKCLIDDQRAEVGDDELLIVVTLNHQGGNRLPCSGHLKAGLRDPKWFLHLKSPRFLIFPTSYLSFLRDMVRTSVSYRLPGLTTKPQKMLRLLASISIATKFYSIDTLASANPRYIVSCYKEKHF